MFQVFLLSPLIKRQILAEKKFSNILRRLLQFATSTSKGRCTPQFAHIFLRI